MASRSRHAAHAPITDLSATLEALAASIGDRIGESIARALAEQPPRSPPERRPCQREGCEKRAAAKGLCKSHYNLMLYHLRKPKPAAGKRHVASSKGKRPASPKRTAKPKKPRRA